MRWCRPVSTRSTAAASIADHEGEWDYNLAWKPLGGFAVRAGWLTAIRSAQARLHAGLDVEVPVLIGTSDSDLPRLDLERRRAPCRRGARSGAHGSLGAGVGRHVTLVRFAGRPARSGAVAGSRCASRSSPNSPPGSTPTCRRARSACRRARSAASGRGANQQVWRQQVAAAGEEHAVDRRAGPSRCPTAIASR